MDFLTIFYYPILLQCKLKCIRKNFTNIIDNID